ncbi:MAG: alpha/beta hydrolase-fold protein [Victivallaceae bacterium]|nr:alpha/beta hydrolase-fold protein [Victivallaceae bacterium]
MIRGIIPKKSNSVVKKTRNTFRSIIVCLPVLFLFQSGIAAQDQEIIKNLKADFRNGQVFITWTEAPVPDGTTFNVYAGREPLTGANLKGALKLAHHIEACSARNWWRDLSSFKSNAKPSPPVGFIIKSGEAPLNPSGGLFVHTPDAENVGLPYYAVTSSEPGGKENPEIIPGANSLVSGVRQSVMPIEAIWQGRLQKPPVMPGSQALMLALHSYTGGSFTGDAVYLLFGPAEHGWREGLPFVFKVSRKPGLVIIMPSNNFFTGRKKVPGKQLLSMVNFWYGYNDFIYDPSQMENGKIFNYSEKILSWLKEWAIRKYSIDPRKVYLRGSSMGGSGAISNALHHPSEYAAVYARVPVVSYTKLNYVGRGLEGNSAGHLEPFCGKNTEKLRCRDGMPLLEKMNGEKLVRKSSGTLPFISMVNGRQDTSMPWENNPGFYRALEEARQGYTAYWDNGTHATAGVNMPEDIKRRTTDEWLLQFSLDQSFPAFSNCSTNKNPGNGKKNDGDTIGWMNRGMTWENIKDEPSRYAVTVKASYPGIEYPVTVDVTPRRLQKFKPAVGEVLQVLLSDGSSRKVTVDESGLFTIKRLVIPAAAGIELIISKSQR